LVLAALLWRGLPAMSVGYVHRDTGQAARAAHGGQDLWGAFIFLGSALPCRSIIFFGLNTFLPLFWIGVLHQSKAAGELALMLPRPKQTAHA
jgi:MFS transporter, FSR family, fosmidomycin resistance protein